MEIVATLTDAVDFDNVGGAAVEGDTLVTIGDGILAVLDVSTPTAPVVQGTLSAAALNGGSEVLINGTWAYVGAGGGVVTVDISDPTTPVVGDTYAITFGVIGLVHQGSTLVAVEQDEDTLYLLNVSNPASIVEESTLTLSDYAPANVAVVGNTLYVGTYSGLDIIDMLNPAAPSLVSTIAGDVIRVAAFGSTLVVLQSDGELQVYDAYLPQAPELLGSVDELPFSGDYELVVSGSAILVAVSNTDSIYRFDYSPAVADSLTEAVLLNRVQSLALNGNVLYAASDDNVGNLNVIRVIPAPVIGAVQRQSRFVFR